MAIIPADQHTLAVNGGAPVRTDPLPLEFPGVHHMDDEEIAAALRVLKSRSPFRYYGIDLQGEVQAFESEFAAFIGAKHALAVSSGTGALRVSLAALGVGPGQEVIVPAYLWVSVVAAVVSLGAIPVLADIDDTFCLDPKKLGQYITAKTSGIILVHMSGAPGDAAAVADVARAKGLFLLEDCAQCAGGSVAGRKVGTFGNIGIFSFQMNKNMTSGEGGCLVTGDPHLYRRAIACHDLGYARDEKGRLILDQPDLLLWGMGYRMDELRAAVLRVQLKKLPRIAGAMHHSKYRIRAALAKLNGIQLRRVVDQAGDTGCFLITTYKDRATAVEVHRRLLAEGIATYAQGLSNILMTDWGLHLYYNIASLLQRTSVDQGGFPWTVPANSESSPAYLKGTCPVADSLFERSILIPIPSCLSSRDEDDIIQAFEKAMSVPC